MSDTHALDPANTDNVPGFSRSSFARETVLTVVIFVLVVCTIFAPWLFYGKAFYWGDIGLFFLPLSHFLKASFASGKIPLWNPYLFCGAPYVGNPQVSLLYPTTLLLPLLPAISAIMISEAVHIFGAGVFFWLLARRGSLKLDYIPSLVAASTYMLCGYFVAKAQFPNMLAALAYVPLLLYQTELLVNAPTMRRSVIFGAMLGLEVLAAHSQITIFAVYLMVPYGLLIYCIDPIRQKFLTVLSAGLGGGLFSALFAAGYILPVLQLLHSSARQALTLKIANRFYLPHYELTNFILQHHFGSPLLGNWHAHGNYWETDNYVGITAVIFALLYVARPFIRPLPEKPELWQFFFWLAVFITNVWLSLGCYGHLYSWMFHILPLLSSFHDPARFMLGANIALALFAGAGVQIAIRYVPRSYKTAAGSAVLLCSVVLLGRHDREIYPLKPVSQIEQMANADVPRELRADIGSVGAGRVLMPDSQRAWQSFTTYRTYEQNDPRFMSEWPNTLSPCLGMSYGLREAGGYDPEYRKDSQELAALAEDPVSPPLGAAEKPSLPANYAEYLSLIGVKYLVTYRLGQVTGHDLKAIYRSSWERHHRTVSVYENTAYTGRATVYQQWTNVANQDDALAGLSERIQSADVGVFDSPLVEGIPSQTSLYNRVASATVTVDQADDLCLVTPPLSSAALLVVADSLHPGWTATVDLHPASILRANLDQRAIYLPRSNDATSHTVEFRYRPADFLFGLYISFISLSVFLATFIGLKNAEDRLRRTT